MKTISESVPATHNFKTLRLLWTGLFIWQFVLVAITYHLIYNVPHLKGPPTDLVLRNIMWGAGSLLLVVSIAMPKYLGGKLTGKFSVARYLVLAILNMGLMTGLTMYGMIVATVYQNILQMVPFVGIAILSFLIHFPRVSLARWYLPKLTEE